MTVPEADDLSGGQPTGPAQAASDYAPRVDAEGTLLGKPVKLFPGEPVAATTFLGSASGTNAAEQELVNDRIAFNPSRDYIKRVAGETVSDEIIDKWLDPIYRQNVAETVKRPKKEMDTSGDPLPDWVKRARDGKFRHYEGYEIARSINGNLSPDRATEVSLLRLDTSAFQLYQLYKFLHESMDDAQRKNAFDAVVTFFGESDKPPKDIFTKKEKLQKFITDKCGGDVQTFLNTFQRFLDPGNPLAKHSAVDLQLDAQLPPNDLAELPQHIHHDSEALFFVYSVEGDCSIVSNNIGTPLKAGMFIAISKGVPHGFRFHGKGEVLIASWQTPPIEKQTSKKKPGETDEDFDDARFEGNEPGYDPYYYVSAQKGVQGGRVTDDTGETAKDFNGNALNDVVRVKELTGITPPNIKR